MEALKADTTGAAGAWVAPCVCCDGADTSPGGASAASAADPAKRTIHGTGHATDQHPVPPSSMPSPLAGKPEPWPKRKLLKSSYFFRTDFWVPILSGKSDE